MLRFPQQLSHQPPISRTLQYKKITKPLLERKRRARINRCLEQLKDLMVGALEAEGENINKLEKADILELTVRHLHRITRPHDPTEEVQRFQAGFTQCASVACSFLLSQPGLDNRVGKRLVEHLGRRISHSLETNLSSLTGHSNPPSLTDNSAQNLSLNNNMDVQRSFVASPTQPVTIKEESERDSNLLYSAPVFPQFDPKVYSTPKDEPGLGLLRLGASQHAPTSGKTSTQIPKVICPQPTRPLTVGYSIPPEISLTITPAAALSPEVSLTIASSPTSSLSTGSSLSTSLSKTPSSSSSISKGSSPSLPKTPLSLSTIPSSSSYFSTGSSLSFPKALSSSSSLSLPPSASSSLSKHASSSSFSKHASSSSSSPSKHSSAASSSLSKHSAASSSLSKHSSASSLSKHTSALSIHTSASSSLCPNTALSPGAMSDGGSSCVSEDMWRPW